MSTVQVMHGMVTLKATNNLNATEEYIIINVSSSFEHVEHFQSIKPPLLTVADSELLQAFKRS